LVAAGKPRRSRRGPIHRRLRRADALDGQEQILMDATDLINEQTTITP